MEIVPRPNPPPGVATGTVKGRSWTGIYPLRDIGDAALVSWVYWVSLVSWARAVPSLSKKTHTSNMKSL